MEIIEKLTRIAIEADEACEYWKDRYKQAQAKAERYENAIKECIERMNEGGPGTRSFIYEKLTGVMEGTQCTGK